MLSKEGFIVGLNFMWVQLWSYVFTIDSYVRFASVKLGPDPVYFNTSMWNYGNGGMWQTGAKLDLCDNDSNSAMNAYHITNLILTPTPLARQPPAANNQGTWTYAAVSILPKISVTEKNKLQ